MIFPTTVPSLIAGSGVFLVKRYAEHGLLNTVRGGSTIGDGSLGIDYQDWQCTFDAANIYVTPQTSGVGLTLAMTNVTQVSLAMDRSNQPNIAYIALGVCKLRWWDATVSAFATTTFAGATRVLVVQDDPRDPMSSICDVVVAYQLADTTVCFRRQRDRYTVEYTAGTIAEVNSRILKAFGMGTQNRLLWRCV